MSEYRFKGEYMFSSPGLYKIEVLGRLDPSWSDRMAGMQITETADKDQHPVTQLVGHLRDQTQLSGILNSLYDLHFPILLVKKIYADPGDDACTTGA